MQRAAELRAAAESQSRQTYQSAVTQHTDFEIRQQALSYKTKERIDYLLGRNPALAPAVYVAGSRSAGRYGHMEIDAHICPLATSACSRRKGRNLQRKRHRNSNWHPAIAHKALADVSQTGTNRKSASYVELRNQGLSPFASARTTKALTQHDPITAFGQWHQAFVRKLSRVAVIERRSLHTRVSILARERGDNTTAATRAISTTTRAGTNCKTPSNFRGATLGRLQDTLDQQSPQADALIAPELLTVMAGGQGSG